MRIFHSLIVVVSLVGATGCGEQHAQRPPRRIVVAGASSLTEVLDDVIELFERAHPGVKVSASFGASSSLIAQIQQGAPIDVVAVADDAALDPLRTIAAVNSAVAVATNRMAIIVPKGNPARITALGDLADPKVKVALCTEKVPCGSLARSVLSAAGLAVTPVTSEENAKAVVAKVRLGEVDAGVVYLTDGLAAADRTEMVPIPDGVNATATVAAAVVTRTDQPVASESFRAFLVSPTARRAFAARGFGPA